MAALPNSRHLSLLALVALALLVLFAAPLVGRPVLSPGLYAAGADAGGDAFILNQLRLPRALTAFCAGALLALGGAVFQSLFRNALATPYTLGVSGGAALGATLSIRLGVGFLLPAAVGVTASAFLGALMAIALVYGLTQLRRGFSTIAMLLAGIAANFLFSSLILLIQYLSSYAQSARVIVWMMGGVPAGGYRHLLLLAPVLLAGGVVVWVFRRELDLMMLGDDLAATRGMNVTVVRRILFVLVSLLVGVVVALCGPIAFVGLIVPHIVRLWIGARHAWLLPASILLGGIFLTVCDTLARSVIAPAELPVGILTSVLGAPFFLWMLISGGTRGGEL